MSRSDFDEYPKRNTEGQQGEGSDGVRSNVGVSAFEEAEVHEDGKEVHVGRVRVAKCHEYDEYICVKIFAGWGKKSVRRCNLVKFSLFWKDLHNYARFLCRN